MRAKSWGPWYGKKPIFMRYDGVRRECAVGDRVLVVVKPSKHLDIFVSVILFIAPHVRIREFREDFIEFFHLRLLFLIDRLEPLRWCAGEERGDRFSQRRFWNGLPHAR